MARTLLTNARLLDGEHPAQPGMTVAISDGRIVAVGTREAVAPQPDDEIYDLSGLSLMPGMVVGHFHATFHNLGAELGAPAMESPPASTAYRALSNVQIALRCGITGVVSAGAPYDIDAQLEQAIESGMFDGPRIVPCSRDTLSSADTYMPWWLGISPDVLAVGICDGPDELRRAIRTAGGRGARMFKMSASGGHGLPGGDRRLFSNAEIRVAAETAHDIGMRMRAHVTGPRAILDCINAGVDILDHCDGMNEACIEAMVKAGSIILPSLLQPLRLSQLPRMFGFSPEETSRDLAHMCAILPKAVEAGVKICAGDDYGTAVLKHGEYAQELAVYVEHAGIAPLEALRWATRNGAALMGREDDLGTVEPGKLADLVVVAGDPSVDIKVLAVQENIIAVLRDGRFVSEGRPPRQAANAPCLAAAA